ncbi:MAG: hypothetical protein JJE51_08160 [Thermoanaerobaculia bacterium]|nr:hypothetical protein [Thermoanaerobaculia bacterium]
MRISIIIVAIGSILNFSALAADVPEPVSMLERGVASYRAGDFAAAAKDLDAAAHGFLSPELMQSYVNTGQMANLDKLETALVYLALAHARLGDEPRARDAILRLVAAERIAPTFATLPLPADAAEFESIAARLVPATSLKTGIAPVQIAQVTPPAQPAPEQPLSAQAAPPPIQSSDLSPQSSAPSTREKDLAAQLARERAERETMIEERLAQERVKIEREATARIAAAERSAQQQVAAAERSIEERVAAERVKQSVALPPIVGRRAWLIALREAYAYGANGQLRQANAIYNRMAEDDGVPRDVLAEAAVGLYQTGAYRDAVRAFERFRTFARGDEDLRYYNAVALYEIGRYDDARRELACALPFIEPNDHVTRYRAKIEAVAR